MNFPLFSVNTTNIFPIANSTLGGQLVSEFNLRTRESVSTAESVQYMIGPSYTHSEQDFYVRALSDSSDYFPDSRTVQSNILEILPGRAVVNGHFIENLVSMTVDMAAINNQLIADGNSPLVGDLAVGLRVMYSTINTMAGSMLPEDSADTDNVYQGIQVVILPIDEFFLPEDKPAQNEESLVTAHLKLATFRFTNGIITNLINNYPAKCQMIPATRVGNVDSLVSDEYIKKTGLNHNKLYVFAGKGKNPRTGYDTWCDANDSLIVWDRHISYSTLRPTVDEATFSVADTGETILILPHKQVDTYQVGYEMENGAGEHIYFKPKTLRLPVADFNSESSGTITQHYTKQVKNVLSKINDVYSLTGGKQRAYIQILETIEDLPAINPNWDIGDYVLVGQDRSFEYEGLNTDSRPPSTMYAVLPPIVNDVAYYGTSLDTLSGNELAIAYGNEESGDLPPNTTEHDVYVTYWGDLQSYEYRGTTDSDYFVYSYTDINGAETRYYYNVSSTVANSRKYTDVIYVTGSIPFASTSACGGFLNIEGSEVDNGYIYLDSDGHLRLLDYGLLRTGVLAYQLGEDFTMPTGITLSEIQMYLDEYVNRRVAFANSKHSQTAENPNVININITIAADEDGGTLDIYDIDSRFNTCVCINIFGDAASNVTINISDCARVRINSAIGGSPVINLYRSCLYYDSQILSYLSTIRDMKLWYARFTDSDANLLVNDMTVSVITSESVYGDLSVMPNGYWDEESPNDNHFMVALQSITFNGSGEIIGCSVLVKNDSTPNVEFGKFVTHYPFEFPQGPALYYPPNRLVKPINVVGTFISAIPTDVPAGYIIQDTHFSLSSPTYDSSEQVAIAGDIAFLNDVYQVNSTVHNIIDSWEPNTFHSFTGTV